MTDLESVGVVGGYTSSFTPPPTIWLAYWPDWSEAAIFLSELEALRHAVDQGGMKVAQTKIGAGLREQTR